MAVVTIARIVGRQAVFDSADTLRVHRGTVAFEAEPKPQTTIDIADAEGRIDTALAMDEVLALIGPIPPLIKLTDADGFPVWVNASKIGDLRATDAWDRGGQPGGIVPLPGVALYSKFFINKNPHMPQQVAETPDEVRSLVQAKGFVIL